MNQFKSQTHHFRTVKTIQLFFTVIVFLLYLICMAAFPDFRVSAASDNLLPLFPHLLIWILTIGSLLFLYFDYKYFYKTIQESDSLRRSAYLDDLTVSVVIWYFRCMPVIRPKLSMLPVL